MSYFKQSQVPFELIPITASQSSSDCSMSGTHLPSMPALLKAISRRPNFSTVFWTRDRTSDGFETSDLTNRPSPPAARMRSMVSWPSVSRRPETTTLAPDFAKRTAVSRPIPVVPPVTSVTLFCNSVFMLCPRYGMLIGRGLHCRDWLNSCGSGARAPQILPLQDDVREKKRKGHAHPDHSLGDRITQFFQSSDAKDNADLEKDDGDGEAAGHPLAMQLNLAL